MNKTKQNKYNMYKYVINGILDQHGFSLDYTCVQISTILVLLISLSCTYVGYINSDLIYSSYSTMFDIHSLEESISNRFEKLCARVKILVATTMLFFYGVSLTMSLEPYCGNTARSCGFFVGIVKENDLIYYTI